MKKLSERQREVLSILVRETEPVEWGSVWDSYSWGDLDNPLAMRNFDRVTDALVRRGLVAYTEGGDAGLVIITEAGREALVSFDPDNPPRLSREALARKRRRELSEAREPLIEDRASRLPSVAPSTPPPAYPRSPDREAIPHEHL